MAFAGIEPVNFSFYRKVLLKFSASIIVGHVKVYTVFVFHAVDPVQMFTTQAIFLNPESLLKYFEDKVCFHYSF